MTNVLWSTLLSASAWGQIQENLLGSLLRKNSGAAPCNSIGPLARTLYKNQTLLHQVPALPGQLGSKPPASARLLGAGGKGAGGRPGRAAEFHLSHGVKAVLKGDYIKTI